jgi:hypothetical protein
MLKKTFKITNIKNNFYKYIFILLKLDLDLNTFFLLKIFFFI